MKTELLAIIKLLDDLQQGQCWIGMNIDEVLKDVSATDALKKFDERSNCIWQLVHHIVYWRKRVVNRLTGVREHPDYPNLKIPNIQNEENWKSTLQDLQDSYQLLRMTISNFPEEKLFEKSPRPEFTYYELMHGVIQHDGYHLGQITLLKKYSR